MQRVLHRCITIPPASMLLPHVHCNLSWTGLCVPLVTASRHKQSQLSELTPAIRGSMQNQLTKSGWTVQNRVLTFVVVLNHSRAMLYLCMYSVHTCIQYFVNTIMDYKTIARFLPLLSSPTLPYFLNTIFALSLPLCTSASISFPSMQSIALALHANALYNAYMYAPHVSGPAANSCIYACTYTERH